MHERKLNLPPCMSYTLSIIRQIHSDMLITPPPKKKKKKKKHGARVGKTQCRC